MGKKGEIKLMTFIYKGAGKRRGATQIFTRSAVDVRVLCLALPAMGGRERERDRPSLVGSVVPATDPFTLAGLLVPLWSFRGSSPAAGLLSRISMTQLTQIKVTILRSTWT